MSASHVINIKETAPSKTCLICSRENDECVRPMHVPTAEDDEDRPIVMYYCSDKKECIEGISKLMADHFIKHRRLPLDTLHPLSQPHYRLIYKASAEELKKMRVKTWNVKRSNGQLEDDWLIRFPIWDLETDRVMITMQQFTTGLYKDVRLSDLTRYNEARLKELARDVSIDEWIPACPNQYPQEIWQQFADDFQHWYLKLRNVQ